MAARKGKPGSKKPSKLNEIDRVLQAARECVKDPQVSEMASHFIHLVGGTQGFARKMLTEYNAAKAGSVARMRILDLILRATKFANEAAGFAKDLGLLSEQDLERLVSERMAAVLAKENADATESNS